MFAQNFQTELLIAQKTLLLKSLGLSEAFFVLGIIWILKGLHNVYVKKNHLHNLIS